MDITAYALDIDAGWGIGTEGAIETAASLIAADTTDGVIDLDNTLTSPVSVTSLTTGAGDILFSQAGGGPLAVALAQTADGDILIDVSGAALRVGTVTAGGIGQNISLTTIGSGDIEVGSVEAAEDRITITSAGAITDGVGKIAAHELIATAGGSMVLDTSVDTLTATNHGELTVVETDAITLITDVASLMLSTEGSGDVAVGESDDLTLAGILVADGRLSVSAGNLTVVGTVSAREVSLQGSTVGSLPGSVISAQRLQVGAYLGMTLITDVDVLVAHAPAGDIVVSESDAIVMEAVAFNGSVEITAGGAVAAAVVADELVVSAAGPITLMTTVNTLTAATSGVGDIIIDETDSIILSNVTTADGSITVTARGDIAAASILAGNPGDVTLAAGGAVMAAVTSDALVVLAGGDVTLDTTVARLEAKVAAAGNVVIRETNDILLGCVLTFDGSIAVTAGGTINAAMCVSMTDADSNDIALTSTGGDIVAAEIHAGTLGDVILSSDGYLMAIVTADELAAVSAGDITLSTTVASLVATTTSAGALSVTETDAIVLAGLQASDGAISIAAGGTITAVNIDSVLDADGNDIHLTTTSGDILIDLVRAGRSSGRIYLTSAGNIREVDAFDPDVDLAARAASIEVAGEFGSSVDPNLELELDLGTLEFRGANLILHHQGDIELIVMVTGVIDVNATGTITATYLESGQGRITIRAGRDILIGFVDAGAQVGVVSLTAGGSILEAQPGDDEVDLIADQAYLSAGASIGGGSEENQYLEVELGTLAAEGGTSIHISEMNDIALASVTAPDGEIDMVAGGEILITGMVSTGTAGGSISLQAGGRIYMQGEEPVATDLLTLVSNSSIFLRTRVNTLDANLAGQGTLEIREADAIVLRNLKNANGPVRVIAGGSMTVVWVESLTDAKGNNIGLMTLGGDIVVDYVGAGAQYGQISVSSAGSILEAVNHDSGVDLSGALGILYAQGRIDKGLDRSFKAIHACGQKYALYEFERGEKLNVCWLEGDVELFFTLENKVHVFATGTITVVYLGSQGNDIYLRSKYQDISVEYLSSAPCSGDIELDADGSVRLAGQLFSGETGQIIAGDDLRIRAGDGIQLLGSTSAGGDIDLWADEGIQISGVVAAADDIQVRTDDGTAAIEAAVRADGLLDVSAGKDLLISAPLVAGGDLELHARGSLKTTNDLATLTAGMNVVLGTCSGDIELRGAVAAGAGYTPCSSRHWCHDCHEMPDLLIHSGAGLFIQGDVTSVDDVEACADDGILIDAGVTAVDAITLHARGSLTVTARATLNAGGDVDLYAKGLLSIGGEVNGAYDVMMTGCSDLEMSGKIRAGDDVIVFAWGDNVISGSVEVGDEIRLSALDDLTLLPGSLLTGILGKPAERVSLFAYDQITMQGTIYAEKLIVRPGRSSFCWKG